MRLLSFERDGAATYGVVVPGGVADMGRLFGGLHADLVSLLRADALAMVAEGAAAAEADVPFSEIAFRPVLGPPAKIICIGLNYIDHVREMKRKVPEVPSLFIKLHESLVGHAQPILRPRVSEHFDFEGELAVVIGRAGRYVAEPAAMGHVAGYTILNDGSIRDWQAQSTDAGKNFPRTGGFGPWLVTAEEIADPHALRLTTRLNGEVVQAGSTRDLIFSIPRLIAYVSSFTELLPGDVISTGTPHGVGHGRTPPLYLKPGDEVEVEIEGIGRLVNRVEQEP